MPRPRAIVTVDEQLLWFIDLPEVLAGAARAATPASLASLGAELDTLESMVVGSADGQIADAVTAALVEWLRELPGLPFVGEPFGGGEGTD